MKRNANAARTGSPARGLEPQLPTQEITTWVLFPPRITPRQTEILLHALLAQCYAAPMTLPGSPLAHQPPQELTGMLQDIGPRGAA